jgi:hypothetical protein
MSEITTTHDDGLRAAASTEGSIVFDLSEVGSNAFRKVNKPERVHWIRLSRDKQEWTEDVSGEFGVCCYREMRLKRKTRSNLSLVCFCGGIEQIMDPILTGCIDSKHDYNV